MMKLTSKTIAKKYECEVFRDSGFDDNHLFWVAYHKPDENSEFEEWTYADGWTLAELVENIDDQISE